MQEEALVDFLQATCSVRLLINAYITLSGSSLDWPSDESYRQKEMSFRLILKNKTICKIYDDTLLDYNFKKTLQSLDKSLVLVLS